MRKRKPKKRPAKTRKIFNATGYDVAGFELIDISGGLLYENASQTAWNGGYYGEDRKSDPPASWPNRWQSFDPAKLRLYARSLKTRVFVLNVEHYRDHELGKLVDILEIIRAERPEITLGVWSVIPCSEFYTLQNYAGFIDFQAGKPWGVEPAAWWNHPDVGPARVAGYEALRQRNDRIASVLLPHVDALFPSVYAAVDYQGEPAKAWTIGRPVELQVDESIRIAKGKPVYPVYSPTLSNGMPLSEVVHVETFKATRKAAGVVVWANTSRTTAESTLKLASTIK